MRPAKGNKMVLNGKGSGQERASKVETRRDLGGTLHLIPKKEGLSDWIPQQGISYG